MIDRRTFLTRSSALLLAAALPAQRSFAAPSAIPGGKVLFGYPPGGIGTLLGRGICAAMTAAGAPYELENIDARNTRQANENVRNAAPDGTVLLQAQSSSLTLLPHFYNKLGYDPVNDFTPLAMTGEFSYSLTVGPMVPKDVTNLQQYLKWLANNPDAREVGFAIYGSQGHISTLILAQDENITAKPQPYRGTAPLVSDLAKGIIAAGFTLAGDVNPELWANGTLRSLGVTRAQRLSYWPNVPTLREQGIEDMDVGAWYGWFAPVRTPDTIVQALRDKLREVQAGAAYKQLESRLLFTQHDLTPDQMRQRIIDETDKYKNLATTYGLKKLD